MTEEGRRVHLVYLEDDNKRISAYVTLLELNESYLKFMTSKNIVTIPLNRMIKMKEAQDGD